MGGQAELIVHPAEAIISNAAATQNYPAIPPPGGLSPSGVATCNNLVADSPPSLLQAYEIYGFTIPAAMQVTNGSAFASAPELGLTLELLINDYPKAAYLAALSPLMFSSSNYIATYVFAADLTNPIRVGARDRLGLRLTGVSSLAAATMALLAGVTYAATPAYVTSEGRILYDVIDLPGSRRI